MTHSTDHLPKYTQEELNILVELIKRYVPNFEMVILFGSYARGGFVLWDEKMEFGIHTSYQSDLDILVVASKANTELLDHRLQKVEEKYHKVFDNRRHPYPSFIVENIHDLNQNLEMKQYFFTDIVNEGIMLYDSGKYELASPRELSFKEIKEFAVNEFNIFYPDGEGFLEHGYFDYSKGRYRLGSFQLHQSCERLYTAISLVFTNYRPKSHKLPVLAARVKEYSRDLCAVFPLNTDFEKRCFDLICRAYIEARYNKDFVVTKEELEYMIERAEILKEITNRICTEKIASYDVLDTFDGKPF